MIELLPGCELMFPRPKSVKTCKVPAFACFLFACGLSLALLNAHKTIAVEPQSLKIQWVASNWAAYHGLTRQCSERLELSDKISSAPYAHARIWPLHAVVDPDIDYVQFYPKQSDIRDIDTFNARLADASFDVLAVAIQLEMIGKDSLEAKYDELVGHFARIAQHKNATLVLVTYATKLEGERLFAGQARVLDLATRYKAKVCPWWETMQEMQVRFPQVLLFDDKDDDHPSRAATFALSYAFYFTLTDDTLDHASVSLQVGDWDASDAPISLTRDEAIAQIRVAWDAVQATREKLVSRSDDRYQSRDGHPAEHLPPYIKQVCGFGERPEWTHDGERILFVEKPMGEVYELDLKSGLIHPKTRHFAHYGFTRANYLANGDILLAGANESFDVGDRAARDRARHQCWLSVMPATGDLKPIPLGVLAAEGPAVSRKKMRIAWTHRDKQDPKLGKNHARHFVGDLVYEDGQPKLANQRVVFDSHQLPFHLGDASLETQDFAGADERLLIFSVYQIEDVHNTDTYAVDTVTGEFQNLTRSPGYYDEAEGVFPDGLHTCVEHAPSEKSAWPLCDIYKLKLDGSGEMQRLTYFSEFRGFKGTQGVVSDDGKKLCFQIGKSGDEAGVGYGFFVMDLEAAANDLEPFRSYAVDILEPEQHAKRFVEAWNQSKPLPAISTIAPGTTLSRGYDIQRAWVRATIDQKGIGGIKGGVVTPGAQNWLGVNEPIGAILRASGRYDAGQKPHLSLSQAKNLKLETEIGFVVSQPIDRPLGSVEELRSYVGGLIPAIELLSGEWMQPEGKPTPADLAAINVNAFGFIVGEPVDPAMLDLKQVEIQLLHNGDLLHTARGEDCWQGPWQTALWLANFAHRQGITLEPGHVILCGALGKVQPATIGQYKMDAGSLGTIEWTVGQ